MIAAIDAVPKNTIEYTRKNVDMGTRINIMDICGKINAKPIFFQSILIPPNPDGKGRAFPDCAFHVYFSAHNINDSFYKRQSKTVAL